MSTEDLEVILVPHSHDDVGWLKTFEEYFKGSNPNIDQGNVRAIISNVNQQLTNDPQKTFVQVEIGFLKLWWDHASEYDRTVYKKLLQKKQIEIINAGVSMNDEACAYYEDIIENHSYGHQWIAKHFGSEFIPDLGWQIDPFGHSQTQAELFSEMGYSEQVIVRIDYEDKERRKRDQVFETISTLPRSSNIMTFIM